MVYVAMVSVEVDSSAYATVRGQMIAGPINATVGGHTIAGPMLR